MSYILDALKRAEAERSRGEVPTIHAPSVPIGDTASEVSPSRLLVWIGAASGLILLAVAAWWWYGKPTVTSEDLAASPPVPVTVPPVVVPSPTAPARPAEPRQLPPRATVAMVAPSSPLVFKPLPSDPVATPPSRPTVRSASEEPVYPLKDLPGDIRAALPAVAVGGASYSENPSSRMLIINGQIYHEGDKLTPELTLQQIQLRSAVLSFRGYRYAISY